VFRATNGVGTDAAAKLDYDCVNRCNQLWEGAMLVRDGMSAVVLTVGPGHTLREAAAAMCGRRVGAAVVIDPEAPGPGVITERDILIAVGAGKNPDQERVADHLTSKLTFAAPDWSLEHAAAAMVRGGFRHLIVVDGGELSGVLSMRDIVRVWSGDGASCELPAGAAAS
jgi:CBS domain-containing protein